MSYLNDYVTLSRKTTDFEASNSLYLRLERLCNDRAAWLVDNFPVVSAFDCLDVLCHEFMRSDKLIGVNMVKKNSAMISDIESVELADDVLSELSSMDIGKLQDAYWSPVAVARSSEIRYYLLELSRLLDEYESKSTVVRRTMSMNPKGNVRDTDEWHEAELVAVERYEAIRAAPLAIRFLDSIGSLSAMTKKSIGVMRNGIVTKWADMKHPHIKMARAAHAALCADGVIDKLHEAITGG